MQEDKTTSKNNQSRSVKQVGLRQQQIYPGRGQSVYIALFFLMYVGATRDGML